MLNKNGHPPLALTMGEPAGIGGEVTLKAWLSRRQENLPPFFLLDDPARIAELAQHLGLDVPVHVIGDSREAGAVFPAALPIRAVSLSQPARPGEPDPANAPAVIGAIDAAVELVDSGQAAAIVTNPIHKPTLLAAGFPHAGHTEYLGALAGEGTKPVMMLACPGLRVIPVTIHVPLAEALTRLSTTAIVASTRIAGRALIEDFGIAQPRLVVAGLNPHAGDGGDLGREEIDIIAPAVDELRADGWTISGPHPPDSLFHEAARGDYDAAVCMYHDQALIPLKTVDFYHGVNITLGLRFVRTSPDHGTALDIAGQGLARPDSLIAAIKTAAAIAGHRAALTAPSHA